MSWLGNLFGFQEADEDSVQEIPEAEPVQDVNEEFLHSASWLTMASSNVEAMRYLAEDEILEVSFKSGSYYQYYNVPIDVARGFIETDSPGRYVWNQLRDRFPYALITSISTKKKTWKPTVVRTRRDLD